MENLTGQMIKGYELLERIGSGGFGAVYRAYQSTIGREVAVKIILPGYANQPEFIRRFEAEAQLVARLEHLHIVPLYDYWREPGGAYLVMRWLRGGNLKEALKEGPFDLAPAALLLDQVVSALATAHANQVVHRDLKPSNILLDEEGNAYLADFSIAKDLRQSNGELTRQEAIIGSPDYLSPEQARSQPVTPQTDIYSLGVTLYEILTGAHPFPGKTAVERLFKHINDPLPLIETLDPAVRDAVNGVIQRATAKNPKHRYEDVLALAAAFREAVRPGEDGRATDLAAALTLREQEILRFIMEGHSNRQIAQELFIELSTVKWHIRQMYTKLGVRSRRQAMVKGRELKLLLPGEDLAGETAPATTSISLALPAPANPYKGLRAFETADSRHFFGRETLIQKLLAHFTASTTLSAGASARRSAGTSAALNAGFLPPQRFLAIVGPSGSGKSSLVRAGLIPALWRGEIPGSERWFVVEMVPGARPLDELEVALIRVAADQAENIRQQLERDEHGLLRAVELILPKDDTELLLVVDQFEELFTLTAGEAARTHFLNILTAAVTDPRSRLRLIITLRADYYDRPLHYPQFGALLRSHMETVLPLSAEQLERAIVQPARQVGVAYEDGLVVTIIDDVLYQPGALPLLQYALAEMFEERDGRLLTHAAYKSIGGAAGALARRAEELYQEQESQGREATRQMYLRLVVWDGDPAVPPDIRRTVPRSDLITAVADEELVDELIDTYAAYRLLTLDHDPHSHRPTVEVAHEALLREWERLRGWLEESRADIRLQRQLTRAAEEWRRSDRDASFLLRGTRLDQFEQWAAVSSVALAANEQAFLAASTAAREQRRAEEEARRQRELETAQKLAQAERQRAEEQARAAQRLRQRAAFLTGALLLAAVLAILAFTFARTANRQAGLAGAQRAEAQAQAALAATREVEALHSAELAATREAEALHSADLAARRQAEAEAAADLQATAEAAAVLEREAAEEQARLAFSRELVASSILNLADDPERSILLALHAMTQADTRQAQEALQEALQSSLLLQRASAEPGQAFSRIVISPDGAHLAVVVYDPDAVVDSELPPEGTKTQVRDAQTLDLLFTLPGVLAGDSWVDANRLPTLDAGDDPGASIFTIWDAAGLPLSTTLLPVALNDIPCLYCLDVSSDLAFIATGLWDGSVAIFDLGTGDKVRTLGDEAGLWLGRPRFSPDGQFLAAGGQGLVLWELATGRELLARPWPGRGAMAFSPDGKQLAYGRGDSTTIVDIASGQEVLTLQGHTGHVYSIDFEAGGAGLVTAALDGSIRWWDRFSGQTWAKLPLDTSRTNAFAVFTPDGARVVSAAGSGAIQVWGLNPAEWLAVSGKGDQDQCGLAFSPDGSLLAIAYCDESVWLLDTISGQTVISVTTPITPAGVIWAPVFSPDGAHLAAAVRGDNTAVVWDVSTGQETLRLAGHTGTVWRVAFSPDGARLATIAYDKTARLWDATSGAPLAVLNQVFTEPLIEGNHWIDLAFSPDGRQLATAGGSSVKVWDTATGAELLALPPDQVWIGAYTTAFSPDGRRLAAGLRFGQGSGVWDVATGEKLFDIAGHFASIAVITYSPDGRQMATTSVDGTIRLWDAATGAAQLTLNAYLEGAVLHLAYSPDGTRLATQGAGGLVRLYPTQVEALVELAQSRLTRWFTPEECRQYLHADECPALP
jgi:WD40 repeat protein/serine/threonine protein kinase